MTSFGAPTECSTGPLYFFDQPTRRNRIKGTRSNILHFNVANEGAQLEQTIQSNPENDNKEGKSDEFTQGLPGETCGDGKPDTSSAVSGALNMKDHDPMDAYKRAAPQLLNELARILSQHKWTEEECLPHGIVNILNYSWQDLTAGAVHLRSPERTDKRRKSKGSLKLDETPRQVSANDKKETGERNAFVGGYVGPPERKTRMKKRKSNYNRAHTSTTISFSISSSSCKDPGWIIQPKQPSCDAPQRMNLCQWVVERLQAARNPVKLETAEQDLNKPLILRHYGDAKAKLKDKRTRSKPATLVNGMPQIPELKQQDPACKKLHYRINDGSSFIYYPSGYMAVCQSHSGLPCGGLYTNVFSDSECPVILATITAFGHGAVTHPLSSAITALWDQDGGFICDHYGSITKEWSWQADRALREKIVIHLSDLITVQLLSGTSAMLSFRCDDESVQLPLSALSNMNPSKETTCLQTDGRFTSDTAQDLLQARKVKSPVVVIESRKNLTLTPVSVCSWEVLQMDRELEGLEGPSAQWRRGGHAGRELKRLQQRARNVLDDWLDYYRVAIGIKCPNTKRMPDAPLRTRLRREVQSAALPSLNPPERADAEPVQPEESRNELQELHRHLSAPAEIPLDSSVKLPRTPKKQTKEESRVTQIGPLQIHGNIKLESVIIPNNPELSGLSVVTCCPAQSSFTPSIPLTVCPPLLRAAILGEGGRRRCCCSTTVMPVMTDLEYDAFVMGQPPHSQQILVVCVTPPRQPINTHSAPNQDALEQLYRRRNKHRTMPCTQCQMDSFRLVRYEMSTGKSSCGVENLLLQHRHNAAPGMILVSKPTAVLAKGCILCPLHVFMDPTGWQQCLPEAREVIAVGGWAEEGYSKVLSSPRNPDIYYKGPKVLLRDQRAAITVDRILCTHTMYIRGKLLFVGYIFSSQSCSVRDLQKQISRTRGDYRLGLSLPSDYKFSDTVNKPSATDSHNSQDATLTGRDVTTLTASVEMEKANDTRNNQVPEASHQRQRDFCVKPKKTPVFPHVPVIMH